MDELVPISHHSVMGTNVVRDRVLEIFVIKAGSPIGRRLALQEWNEASALHLCWNRHAGRVEECFGEVDIGDEARGRAPRLDDTRPSHEQRRP